jgi:hypothetical protein
VPIVAVLAIAFGGSPVATAAEMTSKGCAHLFGTHPDMAERVDDAKAEPGTRHVIRHLFGWAWATQAVLPDDRDNAFILEVSDRNEIHLHYMSQYGPVDRFFPSEEWSCRDGVLRIKHRRDTSEAHGLLDLREWRTVEFKSEDGHLLASFNVKSAGLGFGMIPFAKMGSKVYRFVGSADRH